MSVSKSIIIIGPGEHFGFALAKKFGAENFHIILIARDEKKLLDLSNSMKEENINCSYATADTTSKDELSKALSKVLESAPPIHGLIFNVKESTRGSGLVISPDQLTHVLNTNVSGALAAIQASLSFLSPGASIILTGGGYKDAPDPEKIALSVSKGALHTLFLSLIEPLRERGIKIGTVIIDGIVREDGPVDPRIVAEAFWNVYQAESGKVLSVT